MGGTLYIDEILKDLKTKGHKVEQYNDVIERPLARGYKKMKSRRQKAGGQKNEDKTNR